jgi:hypothetical protein
MTMQHNIKKPFKKDKSNEKKKRQHKHQTSARQQQHPS